MKRSEIFFDTIRVPVDFLACVSAGVLAYAIRVSPLLRQVRPVLFDVELPLKEYLGLVAVVSLFTVFVFAALGLYVMESTRRLVDEIARIIAGITLSLFGVIFWMFIRAELFHSRFILLTAWLFAVLLVAGARVVLSLYQRRLLRRGVGVHRVVLLGRSPVAEGLRSLFDARPELGYRVVGQLEHFTAASFESVRRNYGVDEVIRCDDLPPGENWALLDVCEEEKIDFRYVPDLYETRIGNVVVRTLGGYPLVELRRTPLEGWGRVWKRSMDLAGGLIGLLLCAPLFLVVAVTIALESQGPVFFRQVRVGKHRRQFRIVKFRTMVEHAEQLKYALLRFNERRGPLFKIRDDPRLTAVGRILRRTRIDELPQLFNVLRGDMSLVGPRPHLPQEITEYEKRHRKLFTIRPGMSGLAQVSGGSNLPFEEEASLDIHYVENWSPKLDMVIFFKTLLRLVRDRSAV